MADNFNSPNRSVRTIPLAGGMQDDVPEFQQEFPTLAYVENGRYRKANEVEKRLPNVALTDTNLPSDGTPLMLAEQDDTLITLDESGTLYTFDPGTETTPTWSTNDTGVIPYDAVVERRTGAQPGMGIFCSMDTADGASKAYNISAWEERRPNSDDTTPQTPNVDLVIEIRRPDGSLMDRARIEGGRSPRMVLRLNDPILYFIDETGEIQYAAESGNTVFTTGTGVTALLDHPDVAEAIASTVGITYRDDLRIGFCEDGGLNGMFQVSYAEGSSSGVIFYRDTTFRLYYVSINGSSAGSPVQIEFEATNHTLTPLAVAQQVSGEIGFLFTEWDAVNEDSTLWFEEWDGGVQVERFGELSGTFCPDNGRFVNASMKHDTVSGRYRFAFTVVGNDMGNRILLTTGNTSEVWTGSIDTGNNEFDLGASVFRSHRLASEITFRRGATGLSSRDMVLAVEQWTPSSAPWKGASNEFASVPALIKPVTTVVLAIPYAQTAQYDVLATLGAGQNKCMNASAAEQNVHLNGAYVYGTEPRVCVRNVLQPEDISYHNGLSTAAPNRRINVLFPGEAEGKVVRLSEATKLQTRAFGRGTLFAGAVPMQYDGGAFGEAGVFDQPEITLVTLTDGSGVSGFGYEKFATPATEDWVSISVVLGFTDQLGRVHRSAPSFPVWAAGVTPASTTDDIEIGFTPPLSAYREQKEYFVEVYVAGFDTESGVPKLAHTQKVDVSSPSCFLLNNVTNNNGQQQPLRFSEVLYTEGNVLPSDPWPIFNDFVITSNRMFAISAENPGTVYYSKLFEPGIAPEFSASLVIDLGRNRDLGAIGSIDDKVFVFTKDEIFAIYDTGPDNTGANGDFIVDRLQATVGCEDAESVIEIPDGLLFYSSTSKEFHLISRDLQIVDIGKAVEDTAGDIVDIRAAVLVPDEHEVRWYVENGSQAEFGVSPSTAAGVPARPPRPRYQNVLPADPVLVYNYHYKKWCVHSNQPALHATRYQGQPTYITDNFNPYQADPTAWGSDTDNRLKVRTPWVRISTLQSLGRVDKLTFLGKYLSDWVDNGSGLEAGDVQLTLTYDYEGHNAESDVYRYRANRGDFGTARMQFSATPGRQKCQAVQIEIEEIPTTGVEVFEPTYTSGRGFALSGVDVRFAQKGGSGDKTTNQRTSK